MTLATAVREALESVVTTADIEALRDEAAAAGDTVEVFICDAALRGSESARRSLETRIRSARVDAIELD
jgi:hypothetical protein